MHKRGRSPFAWGRSRPGGVLQALPRRPPTREERERKGDEGERGTAVSPPAWGRPPLPCASTPNPKAERRDWVRPKERLREGEIEATHIDAWGKTASPARLSGGLEFGDRREPRESRFEARVSVCAHWVLVGSSVWKARSATVPVSTTSSRGGDSGIGLEVQVGVLAS